MGTATTGTTEAMAATAITRRAAKPPRSVWIRIAREKAKRELAERNLHDFVVQAWPVVCPDETFIDGWHIAALCQHLEAVSAGKIKQLLINVPPGTMKSLLFGVFWPAWDWIDHPARKFMFASYSDYLSMRDSVRCRDLVTSDWYQKRWPIALKPDQNAKGKWDNARGGWRLATSVGGKGTGEHPDIKGFDDPHNTKEAESDVERQAVLDWWDGTMETRGAMKDAASVGVMQRLHAGDLSGHLIAKGGWEHICLPMRYEAPTRSEATGQLVPRMRPTSIGWTDPRSQDGELLWPEVYTAAKVANLEVKLGIYHAAGQLQQRPSPRGGGMFQRQWFKIRPAAPHLVRIVRYWDKAGTDEAEGTQGARTAGALVASYRDETAVLQAMRTKYIILHVVAFRRGSAEREAIISQTAAADRAKYGHVESWVEQEPGSGGKESAENTIANNPGYSFAAERVTGSKEVRADPLCSQASVGKVSLLAGDWNTEFLDELEAFPVGKLKDMVDAAGGAFNKLAAPSAGIGSASELRAGRIAAPAPDEEASNPTDYDASYRLNPSEL